MDMDVTTDQGQVWQAVTQLGGTVMDLGQRFALMQADTQFSDAKLKARQEINRLSMELEKNPDSDTYQKALNDSISKLWTFQPKNGVAAREYEKWINGMIPTMEGAVNESRRRREITNFKAMGIKIFNEGNMTEYRTHILKGKAIGAYEADDAEILLHDADMRDVFNQAMTMPLENGIDHIKSAKNLTVNEQQSLVDDLKFKKEKQYKAKESELLFKIVNEEITDKTEIDKALAMGEIDASAYRRLIRDLGDSDTNDAAYMEIEDAILDFGSGRKERSEVDELFNKNRGKISKEDKSQLMKKLSSERDKYLDNQTRTGHKIISNIIFSSMGGSDYNDVTGEIDFAKLLAKGRATAEEIAAYRRGSILFNAWLDKQDKTPKEEDIIFQALKIGNQVKQEAVSGNISATLKEMQVDKTAGAKMALSAASMLSYGMPPAMPRIVISTDEEYNKLDSGTEFIDAETGKRYRKP